MNLLCFYVVLQDTDFYKNQSYTGTAPCVLPNLDLLSEVSVKDKRYWDVTFKRDTNWESLRYFICD